MTISRPSRLVAVSLAVALATSIQASPAAAKARPDLRVSRVATGATVDQGGQLTISATTVNAGKAKAVASRISYFLSKDRALGRTDVRLGQARVPKLKPKKKDKQSVTLTVPSTTPPGGWHVLACADATKSVKESKEKNNCAATRNRVTVDQPPPPSTTFPMQPDPLAVGASTLDLPRKVTATAGIDAPTTITATGGDGTTYTLQVPPTALLSAEDITLTPVTRVDGLPLSGGLRAGVQLEPHGLMLQEPVTLVIDSPDLGGLAAQTPFVFHEGGQDLHPHPVDLPAEADDQNTVRLRLTHFSTVGVGSGTAADRSNLAAHPPARPSSQLSSALAEPARGNRESVESGGAADPGVGQEAIGTLEAYAAQIVEPRMDEASGNADLAPGAISEVIAVAKQFALLGDEDNPVAQRLLSKARELLESLVQAYDERCQQHDIRAISLLVGVARQLALLGGDGAAGVAEAIDAATRCSRYEVTLDSTVDYTRNFAAGSQTLTNADHLRVQSTTQVADLGPGVSALQHTEASARQRQEGDGAWTETNLLSTTPGSITVDVLERANPIDPGPGGTPAPPIPLVRLLPGVAAGPADHPPTERMRQTNSLGSPPRDFDQTYWMTLVLAFSEFYPLRLEYELEPKPGDQVLLDKTTDNATGSASTAAGHLTEHRIVKVTHTPTKG